MATTTGYIDYTEQAAPANPAGSHQRLFVRSSDHLLCVVNSSGTVTPLATGSGNVATDTIWDTKGDIAAATGADAASKLAAGANDKVLTAASGQTTGLLWTFPPGYQFDYAQITSNAGPTATTEATANTIITGNAVTYDGSTAVWIEFFTAGAAANNAAGNDMSIWLYDGSSSIGRIAYTDQVNTISGFQPMTGRAKITPSNASHTYSIRASVSAGTGTIVAGAGGNGVNYPAYIRITKV